MLRKSKVKWEFSLKCGEEGIYQKAYQRLDRLPTDQIVNWCVITQDAIQRALESFVRDPDPAAVIEVRRGLLTLLAAARVLEDRDDLTR